MFSFMSGGWRGVGTITVGVELTCCDQVWVRQQPLVKQIVKCNTEQASNNGALRSRGRMCLRHRGWHIFKV